ncbi:hypothetical protein Tco_1224008 [Tanacetum coccineum]
MMTARKRVGPLPTYRLAVRHSVDYSSSDHFTSDDSLRDSSSSSSSEPSSDSSVDVLSDSASSHSSSDHSSLALPSSMKPSHHLCLLVPSTAHLSTAITESPSNSSSSVSPSRKRSRSPIKFIPLSSLIRGALSFARADRLPTPKRIRSSDDVMDLEVRSTESFELSRSRGTDLEMDVDVERSDKPHSEPLIDLVEAVIDACFDFADIIRGSGIDVRAEDVTVAQDEEEGAVECTYETLGDLVHRFHDHTVEIPVHRMQAIESIQRDQGHMIVATGQQSVVLSERIRELERDNTRLRGMMDVASQRVTRLQRRELRVQGEIRQIRHL